MTSERNEFTPQQLAAIGANGNALVIAGAGTGKTRTLVERCVRFVLHKNIGLDQILMVTFTDAAAAEMRTRIRERLESAQTEDPANPRLREQLALLEHASICTLHSFCLQLIRQHFYELQLDPQLTVLTESQARVLREETLDTIFDDAYAGTHPRATDISALIRLFGQARDRKVRELVYQIHEHTQTRPDPEPWFQRELVKLQRPNPEAWWEWFVEAMSGLEKSWLPLLEAEERQCQQYGECAAILRKLPMCKSRNQLAAALESIREIDKGDWKGNKSRFRKPVKGFFDDVEFLRTIATIGRSDPLIEDWEWSAPPLRALLRLSQEFAQRFAAAKRALGTLDFHDLEQFALQLLSRNGESTPLAQQWQKKLELIFIDEYQDINPAQEQILHALSRSDPEPNRFLVGDVKQSIYGFRQAEPEIFLRYARDWTNGGDGGACFPLSHNFRSRERLLDCINEVFNSLMQPDLGGIDYRAEGQLHFGNRGERQHLARDQDLHPRAEFVLCLADKDESEADDRTKAEREAPIIALRLKELQQKGESIWDERLRSLRKIEWHDMVILLRAAKGKVEAYAKEFHKAGVPLLAPAGGLFESLEVQDLLNVLRILDNPLQDRPLIAVLRSPLAGLSADELVHVRLAARKAPFWTALECWHQASRAKAPPPAFEKISTFLQRFHRWRSLARCSSLTQRLEQILEETNYLDWLVTQSRPEQRRANIQQLLGLTREFDDLHRQNLHAFLHFLHNEEETGVERDPPPAAVADAVRLMTIHKSKGLEFPIVVLPDLGKSFNSNDTRGEIILDPELGLCSRVHAPETGQSYPSLPFWLAKKRLVSKMLAEELRLLYVAMTRAQERLILSGSCTEGQARDWSKRAADFSHHARLRRGRSCLDWLGPWLSATAPSADWLDQPEGIATCWRWRVIRKTESETFMPPSWQRSELTELELQNLTTRLIWTYPQIPSTTQTAKSSVTALRRETAEDLDLANPFSFVTFGRPRAPGELDAAEIGLAHHQFLQWLDLEKATGIEGLQQQAGQLVAAKLLSSEQAAALDLTAIDRFWSCEVGQKILAQKNLIQREIPFTVRLTRDSDPSIPLLSRLPAGEFIVVQGAIDLAVLLSKEIWIVDFKTDQISGGALEERAREYSIQLRLYALALAEIYRKPVTCCWLHFLHCGKTIAIEHSVIR